jgi:uncharacterized membrane protein YhdT
MGYTKLGRVAAGIALVLRVAGLVFGYKMGPSDGVTADGFKLATMLVNNGFICLLFAIIMGVLTDISMSVAKGDKGE